MSPIKLNGAKSLIGTSTRRVLLIGFVCMSDKLTIFGQNLRALCGRKPSISSVARDLEVGRVQFGRYLNGTSFPKPDLLDRICRYFNVDVAIFIRPLDEIEAEQKDWMKKANALAYLQSAASYIEESTTYEGFSRHLPDGIHCLWLNSFSDLSSVHCRLMQVRTVDGTRLIKGYDRVGRLISDNFPAPLLKKEYRGTVLASSDGFTILTFGQAPARHLTMTFISLDYIAENLLGGFSVLSRGEYAGRRRITRCVFQLLPQSPVDILRQARICEKKMTLEDVPEIIRNAIAPSHDLV